MGAAHRRSPRAARKSGHGNAACTCRRDLAVVPFASLSAILAEEYFADGMVDELITALSRLKSFVGAGERLRCVPRSPGRSSACGCRSACD
jgi:TolB-like protein